MLTWTMKGIIVDRIVMRVMRPQGDGKASSRARRTERADEPGDLISCAQLWHPKKKTCIVMQGKGGAGCG